MQAPRALVFSLLSALSCTAAPRAQGEQCVFNDDCAAPLVCAARRCRAECRSSRDCVAGWKCSPVRSGERSVCVPGDHPDFCQYHSQCEAPRVCGSDGLCRLQCREPRDCADFSPELRCALDAGVCLWPQELSPP